jgi:hypothetical protein
MGARRFELRTSSLSGTRSNQLSYAPGVIDAQIEIHASGKPLYRQTGLALAASIHLTVNKGVMPLEE